MTSSDSPRYQIVVMAKSPVAGKVKTRLCPPLSFEAAAELATASLCDTLSAVVASHAQSVTLALDGAPGGWLPPSMSVLPQRGNGLAARIANAFDDAWSSAPLPTVLIGMDTPQVTGSLLDGCAQLLLHPDTGIDAVLGLARDGGWWALGLQHPDAAVFAEVPMSQADTGSIQLERLRERRHRVAMLPTLIDVDLISDAYEVAAIAPDTAFAASLSACVAAA